jgi:2-polyprenyl-3-methyl-5-hydroxy-6-metoxy-1,4-benzoquinol methylase
MDQIYDSERVTLQKILPHVKTVTDVGCLFGDLYSAMREDYDISYRGLDIDEEAIVIAGKRYPDANFYSCDILNNCPNIPKSDLVISFNLFDHYEDWKKVLRAYRMLSNRYINFSTHMRLSGSTVLDKDLSYMYYNGKDRLLWAAHNIWELTAYCATEEIAATSIYIYCYNKFRKGVDNNFHIAKKSMMPMDPNKILVGNIIIEHDEENSMKEKKKRPDLKILVNGEVILDSPWKPVVPEQIACRYN